jgi:hypothetical protein
MSGYPAVVTEQWGTTPGGPAAGWYADPWDSSSLRYWDGAGWTEHVAAGAAPIAPVSATPASRRADVVLGAGGVLVLLGSVLPWLGRDGRSFSSWSYPVESMLRGEPTGGPSTGLALLVVGLIAVLLALLPTLVRRTPRPVYSVLAGSIAFDLSLAAVMASATVKPSLTLGIGAFVTLAGSVLIAVHSLLAKSRWYAAGRVGVA